MEGTSIAKKPSTGGWRSAFFIIFVEVAERFAYYGVAGNLFVYLTKVLGQTSVTAAKNVNTWQGVSAVFPVVGGFLADSYMGRYKMILISSIIYLVGLILLTLAVTTIPFHFRHIIFFLALYILAIGEGGHKPCVQTFAADQFDENLPEEKVAKSSFFNWWYVGIVFGATAAILVVIYVEDYVGWGLAYGMLAAVVAGALVIFLAGSWTYRVEVPVGSPFTRVAQVVVAAARKRMLDEKQGRGLLLEEECNGNVEGGSLVVHKLARTRKFRFLDKAMIIDNIDAASEKRNPWRLCSLNQVEEVKLVLQLIPIWLCCLMFATTTAQQGTYFTKQGSTMNRNITPNFQVPAATFQVVTGLTILFSVLMYEQLLVPIARSITGHRSGITILQRIGTGLVTSIMAMVVAALIESRRLRVAHEHGLLDKPTSVLPMPAWWLIPQYMLIGISDMFTVVGLQELFYDQMPVEMRSIGAAAYISVTGVGSFLSTGLISIVQGISSKAGHEWFADNLNRANLEDFYWLLAGMGSVNFCVYLFVANRYVYKEIQHKCSHNNDEEQ